MAGFISNRHDERVPRSPGPNSLFVGGVRYANAAAKFWASLIDDIRQDFPNCSMVELTATTGERLEPRHLFPEIALEEDLHDLLEMDIREMMRNTLAELEMLGAPSSVHIRLHSGRREVLSVELPLDCIDAEIFPYVLVWPLQWAGIPDCSWNSELLSGDITAEDRKRGLVYQITFSLMNHHLGEGLFRRSISMIPSVETVGELR